MPTTGIDPTQPPADGERPGPASRTPSHAELAERTARPLLARYTALTDPHHADDHATHAADLIVDLLHLVGDRAAGILEWASHRHADEREEARALATDPDHTGPAQPCHRQIAEARAAWVAAGRASADARARYAALCAEEERGTTPPSGDLHTADDDRIATAEAEAAAARGYLGLLGLTPTVTVTVDNTYQCGRHSQVTSTVAAPLASEISFEWWTGEVTSGDGHPCGARENALYRFRIVASPDLPDLVGTSYEWS